MLTIRKQETFDWPVPVQRPRKMQEDHRPILEQCHGASHLCRSYREEIKIKAR